MRTPERSAEAYDRFSRTVDAPMMILALAMVPLLVVPLIWPLAGTAASGVDAADWFIWILFVGEYVTKLYLSPSRSRFAKTHVLDLLVIAVPMLRPLRVLRAARAMRLLRLARVVPVLTRGLRDARAIMGRKGLRFTLLFAVLAVFAAAGAETVLESGAKGGNIHGFADGLWWAVTTVTTVGYGDKFPVTGAGRGVAVALMLTGIAVFGAVTASIAAFFVETNRPDGLEEISDRLGRIETALAQLVPQQRSTSQDQATESVT
ncbi:MAG TPA: ion channel [Acidothermaceae bacterium]|nr:ion channel [Acidothermaceae bacterium]